MQLRKRKNYRGRKKKSKSPVYDFRIKEFMRASTYTHTSKKKRKNLDFPVITVNKIYSLKLKTKLKALSIGEKNKKKLMIKSSFRTYFR